MVSSNLMRLHSRVFHAVLLYVVCSCGSFAADTYDGFALSIPSLPIGAATYTNVVVTVGGILSGPSGSTGNAAGDSYNPANNQLSIPTVVYGAKTYHNVVISVGRLISIESVAGADTYDSPDLNIGSVQVGSTIYNNAQITFTSIVSFTGGMPAAVRDQYNPANGQLLIPAVQVGVQVYTNVIVSVASVKTVGGIDVPNVVGLTQAAATTAIGATRLVVGTITTGGSPTVPSGLIASQIPAAGATAAPGSAVRLTVSLGPLSDALTYHYDAARSGLNPLEKTLTASNVNSANFGKVAEFAIDGAVNGSVLFVNKLAIPSVGTRNVVYFATENDSMYALDAATITGGAATVLWKASVLGANETTVPVADVGCGATDPLGVTATPVIDRSRNAIYVLSFSIDASSHFIHRLHALSLTTGHELFGGPVTITATYPVTVGARAGQSVVFQPQYQLSRAALLESNGTIYAAFGGQYGVCGEFNGWLMGYSADTLAQASAINLTPNSNRGGIWLGGGGPSADSAGNIFVPVGDSTAQVGPGASGDYDQSLVRLSGSGNLAVADFFGLYNAVTESNSNLSLASSNSLLLPDLVDGAGKTRHLATASGKDGVLYIVDRDSMGGWNASSNNVYQQITLGSGGNYSSPAYFNHSLYIGPNGLPLQAYTISQARLSLTPSSQSATPFGIRGTVPSVSSNGTSNGIVWALDGANNILYAYNAATLRTELYDSNQADLSRDHFAHLIGHFNTPMVANGRVYFGTGSTLAVFGLLPP